MVVFTVFFKRVADVQTQGVPYPLFSYIGLLPWTFFSGALSKGAVSIVQNLTLLNKVYCPREVFPLASVTIAAVDTGIAVSILGVLFVVYRFMPQPDVGLGAGAHARAAGVHASGSRCSCRRSSSTCATCARCCRCSCSSGCSPRRSATAST